MSDFLLTGGYGTHLPALMDALYRTTGAVLELGCGDYSTPILAAFCQAAGRQLVSIECDEVWRKRYQHAVGGVPEQPELYSVCLVDLAPLHFRRSWLDGLRRRVQVWVMHDAEDPAANYPTDWRYFRLWNEHMPHTLVGSDVVDLFEREPLRWM